MATIYVNGSSTNVTVPDDSGSSSSIVLALPKIGRFWFLLVFEVPSFFCCLFVLYHLCFDQTQRKALNNHVIIIVLMVNLLILIFDIPNYLTLLYLGYIWPQSPINCYIWLFIDIAGYYGLGILMAWASIERHILVFHQHWLNTPKKRFFLHYLPLISILLYLCIFYTILIFFVPCDQTIDYTQYTCSGACAYGIESLSMFDGLVNGDFPTLIITIFNILLILRVIKQKQRLRQQIQWRKYRRMVIQLVSCSALFIIFNLPLVCIYIAQAFGVPYGATGQFEMFVYFLAYLIILWMPFVCLGSSPEIWSKLKVIKTQSTTTQVVPR